MQSPHESTFTKLLLAAILLAAAPHLVSAELAHGEPIEGRVTINMRESAHITGQPTLGDVCKVDGIPTELLGRIVISETSGRVEIADVVRLLEEAGIGEHRLLVRGPLACEVEIIEPAPVASFAEDDWTELTPRTTLSVAAPATDMPTLKDRLQADLAARLSLPVNSITLAFRTADLALADSHTAQPADLRSSAGLGRLNWQVIDGETTHTLALEAAATIGQLVLVQPVRRGQVIREDDFEVRPVSLTRLADRGVDAVEAVGQQAARDLRVGDVIQADSLAPRLLVRRGEFITVTLRRGNVELRTIAQSQDDATFGQAVRARCESTGELLRVSITGPQAGTVLK